MLIPYFDAPEAYDALFREVGAVMAEWSSVENALLEVFESLTGLKPRMARQVFFSARSFNGRADMLRAALNAVEEDGHIIDFTRAALKKALQYSAFRNAVAHGYQTVLPELGGPHDNKAIITEERERQLTSDDVITVERLKVAQTNFHALATCISHVGRWQESDPGPNPQEFAEKVRLLPNPPQSKEADLSFLETDEFAQALHAQLDRMQEAIRTQLGPEPDNP